MTTTDEQRHGGWLQMYTGRAFWPLDPRVNEIDINDISHALSKLCRYGGHCHRFYCVAEHSVLIAENAPDDCKLEALLHDGPEGLGLVDMPRPVKRYLPGYDKAEHRLMAMVAERFKLKWPIPAIVKELDNRILIDEYEQNMARVTKPWGMAEGLQPLGVTLKFWTPQKAAYEFLTAFYRYGGRP